MKTIADIIGLFGVFLTLIAYLLLSMNKIRAHKFYYPFLNSVGSLMILFSLYFTWNLSAWIMELCWVLISLVGVIKYLRRKYHA